MQEPEVLEYEWREYEKNKSKLSYHLRKADPI